MTYTQTLDRLHVCSLDQTAHARTCGYWFTVSSRATACTAFATKAALQRWADERGLTLPDTLGEAGTFSHGMIDGQYRDALDNDEGEFYALDGVRTVHKLNVNVRNRLVFDRADSERVLERPL